MMHEIRSYIGDPKFVYKTTKYLPSGQSQHLYRFANNYGASIITMIASNRFSFNEYLEIAVIRWQTDSATHSSWRVDNTTPVTDRPIECYSPESVENIIDAIKELRQPEWVTL